jgi:hypothetical protein
MLTGRNGKRARVASAITLTFAVLSAPTLQTAGWAHATRVQTVTDYAHLRLVSANGNTLVESGKATGTLPGTVQVSLTLRNRKATSSFSIHTPAGTIAGHGEGILKAGRHGWDSFGGWVVVSGGTDRFRGAHGKGGLYGAIYRVTDAMTVQVTGKLYY